MCRASVSKGGGRTGSTFSFLHSWCKEDNIETTSLKVGRMLASALQQLSALRRIYLNALVVQKLGSLCPFDDGALDLVAVEKLPIWQAPGGIQMQATGRTSVPVEDLVHHDSKAVDIALRGESQSLNQFGSFPVVGVGEGGGGRGGEGRRETYQCTSMLLMIWLCCLDSREIEKSVTLMVSSLTFKDDRRSEPTRSG